jgi:hypothetical protein
MSPGYRAFSAAWALQTTLDCMANKIEPARRDSPHWYRICPGTSNKVSDNLWGTYQKTAIALRNLISDAGFFNTATANVDQISYINQKSTT